jgi:hypothetical protein
MKPLRIILACFIFSIPFLLSAQVKLKTASGDNFSDSIRKIVHEYRFNFSGLQGAPAPADPGASSYRSKICLPGALQCLVTKYRSQQDKSASWQAIMYSGESYEEAVKKYNQLVSQLKRVSFANIEKTSISLQGKADKPEPDLKFAVTSLRFRTKDAIYQFMVADVELISQYDGWELHLNIYTNKALNEEAGEEEDN